MIHVRFFAGAADAVDRDRADIAVGVAGHGMELGALREQVIALSPSERTCRVIDSCSFLVEGQVAGDPALVVPDDAHVDVLPPFAGG